MTTSTHLFITYLFDKFSIFSISEHNSRLFACPPNLTRWFWGERRWRRGRHAGFAHTSSLARRDCEAVAARARESAGERRRRQRWAAAAAKQGLASIVVRLCRRLCLLLTPRAGKAEGGALEKAPAGAIWSTPPPTLVDINAAIYGLQGERRRN